MKDRKAELREFVYLDETSVCSLVAARVGSIADSLTATQSESLQSELGGSASVAGVAKVGFDAKATGVQSSSTQVLRKTIIQSTFKELHDIERNRFAIKPAVSSNGFPRLREGQDIEAALRSAEDGIWIIDTRNLQRGQLFEVKVELATEPIYQFSAMTSAISSMIQSNPEFLGLQENSGIAQMTGVNQLLEKLLANLVPIRGRLLEYRSVVAGDGEWLIHKRVLSNLPPNVSDQAKDVYAVGVAEQSLFWKDIRRVLFSDSHYHMLCRIAKDGIHKSWTPVKLSHVLDAVAPQFGQTLEDGGRSALFAMSNSSNSDKELECRRKNAFMAYAENIAAQHEQVISDELEAEIGIVAHDHSIAMDGVIPIRNAFGIVTELIAQRLEIKVTSDQAVACRTAALLGADLWLNGQDSPLAGRDTPAIDSNTNDRYLDSEIVAIYW